MQYGTAVAHTTSYVGMGRVGHGGPAQGTRNPMVVGVLVTQTWMAAHWAQPSQRLQDARVDSTADSGWNCPFRCGRNGTGVEGGLRKILTTIMVIILDKSQNRYVHQIKVVQGQTRIRAPTQAIGSVAHPYLSIWALLFFDGSSHLLA